VSRLHFDWFSFSPLYFQSSAARGAHSRPRSTQAPLLDRFASLFRHSHADGAIELQRRPTQSIFSHRPSIVEVSAVQDKQVCISLSLFPIAVQSFPVSRCLLPAGPNMTGQDKHNNSNLSRTARDRPQHPMLQALVLPCWVQGLSIHNSDACWLIWCSFSVAHPLNVPVPMHNQHSISYKAKRRPMRCRRDHSTIKVNHKAYPRLRRHRHRLSLPLPPPPRHLLLLMPILLRQVQQACSPAPCHCGPVSFFFSAVHPSHMQTDTSTPSLARSSQFEIWHFVIVVICSRSMYVFNFTTSSILVRFDAVLKSRFMSSSCYQHVWLQIMMLHSMYTVHHVLVCLVAHNLSNGEAKSIRTETLTSLRRSLTFPYLTGCQMG
jgi:hypothetical protein